MFFFSLQKCYGIFFITTLAIISFLIINLPGVAATGISSLMIAILLGVSVGNIWHYPKAWTPGVQFCAKKILRIAIVLYGFRISFQQIYSVGSFALLLDVFVVISTLIIGFFVGRKLLKLDREMSLLISAGSAICGAAAVLAVEDVLKSEPYKAVVAIATVVLFGTISMFLYPMLQHTGKFILNNHQFGLFAGASVHEVAQALVAGTHVSVESGKIAVIVKMIRVLLLVPVLFILSIFRNYFSNQQHDKKTAITIPWFAVGFILVIGFNSLQLLSTKVVEVINYVDTFLLTIAMAAIGVETTFRKVKNVGLQPFYLAIILFGWLMTSVYTVILLI